MSTTYDEAIRGNRESLGNFYLRYETGKEKAYKDLQTILKKTPDAYIVFTSVSLFVKEDEWGSLLKTVISIATPLGENILYNNTNYGVYISIGNITLESFKKLREDILIQLKRDNKINILINDSNTSVN